MKITITAERSETGAVHILCPELPGLHTFDHDLPSALREAADASEALWKALSELENVNEEQRDKFAPWFQKPSKEQIDDRTTQGHESAGSLKIQEP